MVNSKVGLDCREHANLAHTINGPSGEAQSGCGAPRLATVALRVVLMVNSGSASAPRSEFWLSGEAQSMCVTVHFAILAPRVDLMVNSGSASAQRCAFWLSGEAQSGGVTVRIAMLALRVVLMVNSGSAGAQRCAFWLNGEAQSGCGAPRLATVALRVGVGLYSLQFWLCRWISASILAKWRGTECVCDYAPCDSSSASGSQSEVWLCECTMV
jgi:hypothetical protein